MTDHTIPLGPMEITQWGQCNGIWNELTKNFKTVIGGFEFELQDLRSIVEQYSVPTKDFFEILSSYCYIPLESNPGGLDIRTMYELGESATVTFDPLASANLDWNRIHVMLHRAAVPEPSVTTSNLADLQDQLLEQVEIRFNLFANREEQRALIAALKQRQKELLGHWIPFASRIDLFWDTAYEICLEKKYDHAFRNIGTDLSAGAERALLNLFFLANRDFRWNFLDMLHVSVGVHRQIPDRLKELGKMMDTLHFALSKMESNLNLSIYENAILQAIERLMSFTNRLTETIDECRYMMLDTYVGEHFLDRLDDLPFDIDQLNGYLLSDLSIPIKLSAVNYTQEEIALVLEAWDQIEQELEHVSKLRSMEPSDLPTRPAKPRSSVIDDAFYAALDPIMKAPDAPVEEKKQERSSRDCRYFLGTDIDDARSQKRGYKQLARAKNRAKKDLLNIYDAEEGYQLVWTPEQGQGPTADPSAAESEAADPQQEQSGSNS